MGGGNAEGTLDILMFHILINHTCITNEPEEENTCQTSEEDARQIELAIFRERARSAVPSLSVHGSVVVFCSSNAVFWSGDKLKNGGGGGRFWPKSAHDSFINQLPGRVGRLNEVWWLWIMYRTDWMEQGQSCGYSMQTWLLQARWHRRVTHVPCQSSVLGFSGAPIPQHAFQRILGFFASTHATDPVITRLLGVLCLPDSVLSHKKLKHPCRLH